MKYDTFSSPVVVGETYSIICSAIIVDNVLGDNPTIRWTDPSGSVISPAAPDVSIGNKIMLSEGASLELIFRSFDIAQTGVYICEGCINVPEVSIADNCANITADTTLNIPCECCTVMSIGAIYV